MKTAVAMNRLCDGPNHRAKPLRYPDFLSGARRERRQNRASLVARAIGNSAALRPFTGREVAPGPISGTEQERFFRDGLGTFWHQSASAKMGRDEMSVVDGQLKVYGVDSLRISDASILPRVTTGNTMAPSVVIGEQATAFLTKVGSGDEAFHSVLEGTTE